MAKSKNNPLLKGLSGQIGKVVVVRQVNGKTVVSNYVVPKDPKTEKQQNQRGKFKDASRYASGQMLIPHVKKTYADAPKEKPITPRQAAFNDYLKGPEIISVDSDQYKGNAGDIITIRAKDNFRVMNVHVTIVDKNNKTIERGEAVPDRLDLELWSYATQENIVAMNGVTIRIVATDLPENSVTKEITIV